MTDKLAFVHSPREWLEHNSQLLTRLLIIAAVLLVSVVLARHPSARYLILLIAPAGAAILMRYPPLGLIGIVIACFVPIALGTGTQTEIGASMLLLAAMIGLWVLDMIRRRDLRLMPSRTLMPLAAFITVVFLSFGAGQLPWFIVSGAPMQAQLGGVAIFVFSAGAFLLVRHQIQSPAWLERMTWAFLAVGGLYLFSLLLPGLHSVSRLFPSAVGGSLFWTWITAMSFSQAVFNRKLHPAWRVALGAVLAAAMYISLVQKRDWNSGWTPALVTIVVILWAGAPKFGLLATLVGGAAALSRFGAVENFAMAGDNQYSLMTRVEAWRILAEIIKVNPIFGLGPANYYWYTPLFPILGYAVKFNSHNNYVDLVAQTGLLGLACFLWFAWEVGRAGWRLRLQVPEGFQQAYVYGALGGLAGTIVAGMLGDWFLPFVYNIGFAGFRASVLGWLFLGGLMSLESSVGTESTAG